MSLKAKKVKKAKAKAKANNLATRQRAYNFATFRALHSTGSTVFGLQNLVDVEELERVEAHVEVSFCPSTSLRDRLDWVATTILMNDRDELHLKDIETRPEGHSGPRSDIWEKGMLSPYQAYARSRREHPYPEMDTTPEHVQQVNRDTTRFRLWMSARYYQPPFSIEPEVTIVSLNKKMGDKHEEHLAEVFGGRKTRGSGNQPANPMDGRHNRYEQAVAFAWDGKSTRARSMSVSRAMLDKAKEQALSERPMLSLRFYDDDRLKSYEDWHLIREDDLLELMERSERLAELENE